MKIKQMFCNHYWKGKRCKGFSTNAKSDYELIVIFCEKCNLEFYIPHNNIKLDAVDLDREK